MLDLDRRWRRPAPSSAQVRTDVLIAVAAAVLSVVSVEVWHSAYGTSLGWNGIEAYLLFAVAGLALAGRRRAPLITLLVESAIFITIGERLVELGVIFTIQIILFASLYAAWAWSRFTRTLYVVSALVLAAMFGWLLWSISDQMAEIPLKDGGLVPPEAAVVVYSLAINVVYFFGAMAWGHVAWRSARQRAEIAEQADRERNSRLRERDRAVQAERVRIARDLHDVVAHHVSGIGVQAAGAGRVLESRPDDARRALSTIELSSREAVSQMHQLVGLLRSDGDAADPGPRPGIADLSSLVGSDARPALAYREVGEPFGVPATVGLSLFRVAQEAISNTRRHARAETAEIVLRYLPASGDSDRSVEIEIIDDGSSATQPPSGGGFGLLGIRERAAMHHGSCEIGRRPQGGFRVRVRVPVDGS